MTRSGKRGVRVTPSMRRKVDDLATWLGEGDQVRIRAARRTIVDLLCAAAGLEPDAAIAARLPRR